MFRGRLKLFWFRLILNLNIKIDLVLYSQRPRVS